MPLVPATANEFVEQQLDQRLRAIETAFSADAISLSGPLIDGVDDILRKAVEKRAQEKARFGVGISPDHRGRLHRNR